MTPERKYAGWTVHDILNHKGPVDIPSAVLIELMVDAEINTTDFGPQPPLRLRLRQPPLLPVTSVYLEPYPYGQPASDSPAQPPAAG